MSDLELAPEEVTADGHSGADQAVSFTKEAGVERAAVSRGKGRILALGEAERARGTGRDAEAAADTAVAVDDRTARVDTDSLHGAAFGTRAASAALSGDDLGTVSGCET